MKRTLGDAFYLSFNLEKTGPDKEFEKYLLFSDLLTKAKENIGHNNSKLRNIAQEMLKIESNNYLGKAFLATADALETGSFHNEVDDQHIYLLLKAYTAIRTDCLNDIDGKLQQNILNEFKNDREFQNNFRSFMVLNHRKFALPDLTVSEYMHQLLADGHVSWELIEAIDEEQFKKLMKRKLDIVIDQIRREGKTSGNMLACYADDKMNYFHHQRCGNVYYDEYSMQKVYRKGTDTINSTLAKLISDPSAHLIIVVSHKGILLDDFDAFIFGKDKFILVKNILLGVKQENISAHNYSDLNIGINFLGLSGQKYHNTALNRLLVSIKGRSIKKIHRNKGEPSGFFGKKDSGEE